MYTCAVNVSSIMENKTIWTSLLGGFFYSSTDSWQYRGSSFNRNYVAEIINMAIPVKTMLHPMYFLLYFNECYLLVLIYIKVFKQ